MNWDRINEFLAIWANWIAVGGAVIVAAARVYRWLSKPATNPADRQIGAGKDSVSTSSDNQGRNDSFSLYPYQPLVFCWPIALGGFALYFLDVHRLSSNRTLTVIFFALVMHFSLLAGHLKSKKAELDYQLGPEESIGLVMFLFFLPMLAVFSGFLFADSNMG
ncbi:MAG: hypothetical protein K8T89_07095 [Planctomycetes bacterium]|nr:hypothetical protein [Planctomycetota bacterium]